MVVAAFVGRVVSGSVGTEAVGRREIIRARVSGETLVLAFDGDSKDGRCEITFVPTVEASTDRVVAAVTGARARQLPWNSEECGDQAIGETVQVNLDGPLGDRPLVDGSTGERVEVRTRPVWLASWLPPGLSEQAEAGFTDDSWSVLYTRGGRDRAEFVEILTGSLAEPGGRVIEETVVHGQPARILDLGEGRTSVNWTESDQTISVWGDLDPEVLVAVAAGTRPE